MREYVTLQATSPRVWTAYERQKKPPGVREQEWEMVTSEGAKLCCDLIPPLLLLSCLSQALQRIGLWLKLSVRGD